MKVCPSCGVTIPKPSGFCTACGYEFSPRPSHQLDGKGDDNISVPSPFQQEQPTPSSYPVASNRVNIAFAALFMGFTGIHKFQTGKTALGFLYIAMSLFSLLIFFSFYFDPEVGLILGIYSYTNTISLPGVISTIEGIRYFCLSNEHFKEIYGA